MWHSKLNKKRKASVRCYAFFCTSENVFTVGHFLVDFCDKQSFESPKLQKHTTWLCEFQSLNKVRGNRTHTGVVFKQPSNTRKWWRSCLTTDTRDPALLSQWMVWRHKRFCWPWLPICLLDSSVVSALIQGACLHWWPINQLLQGKKNQPKFVGYKSVALHSKIWSHVTAREKGVFIIPEKTIQLFSVLYLC